MSIWKVWGTNLSELLIKADSFDNALDIARKVDPRYSMGQIYKHDNYNVRVVYRVYGEDGHRQRASFGSTFSFTTFEDVKVKCMCSDVTGTNDYVDIELIGRDLSACLYQLQAQLSDGIFENCAYGKVIRKELTCL